eukprot:GDKJ01063334.1.p1 GENE.GDKJ01063334.1~~GDKJ01063334.1.p1  ORF type:complete len:1683 (-),score=280.67 GDKJ01063334.1:65-5113(-)
MMAVFSLECPNAPDANAEDLTECKSADAGEYMIRSAIDWTLVSDLFYCADVNSVETCFAFDSVGTPITSSDQLANGCPSFSTLYYHILEDGLVMHITFYRAPVYGSACVALSGTTIQNYQPGTPIETSAFTVKSGVSSALTSTTPGVLCWHELGCTKRFAFADCSNASTELCVLGLYDSNRAYMTICPSHPLYSSVVYKYNYISRSSVSFTFTARTLAENRFCVYDSAVTCALDGSSLSASSCFNAILTDDAATREQHKLDGADGYSMDTCSFVDAYISTTTQTQTDNLYDVFYFRADSSSSRIICEKMTIKNDDIASCTSSAKHLKYYTLLSSQIGPYKCNFTSNQECATMFSNPAYHSARRCSYLTSKSSNDCSSVPNQFTFDSVTGTFSIYSGSSCETQMRYAYDVCYNSTLIVKSSSQTVTPVQSTSPRICKVSSCSQSSSLNAQTATELAECFHALPLSSCSKIYGGVYRYYHYDSTSHRVRLYSSENCSYPIASTLLTNYDGQCLVYDSQVYSLKYIANLFTATPYMSPPVLNASGVISGCSNERFFNTTRVDPTSFVTGVSKCSGEVTYAWDSLLDVYSFYMNDATTGKCVKNMSLQKIKSTSTSICTGSPSILEAYSLNTDYPYVCRVDDGVSACDSSNSALFSPNSVLCTNKIHVSDVASCEDSNYEFTVNKLPNTVDQVLISSYSSTGICTEFNYATDNVCSASEFSGLNLLSDINLSESYFCRFTLPNTCSSSPKNTASGCHQMNFVSAATGCVQGRYYFTLSSTSYLTTIYTGTSSTAGTCTVFLTSAPNMPCHNSQIVVRVADAVKTANPMTLPLPQICVNGLCSYNLSVLEQSAICSIKGPTYAFYYRIVTDSNGSRSVDVWNTDCVKVDPLSNTVTTKNINLLNKSKPYQCFFNSAAVCTEKAALTSQHTTDNGCKNFVFSSVEGSTVTSTGAVCAWTYKVGAFAFMDPFCTSKSFRRVSGGCSDNHLVVFSSVFDPSSPYVCQGAAVRCGANDAPSDSFCTNKVLVGTGEEFTDDFLFQAIPQSVNYNLTSKASPTNVTVIKSTACLAGVIRVMLPAIHFTSDVTKPHTCSVSSCSDDLSNIVSTSCFNNVAVLSSSSQACDPLSADYFALSSKQGTIFFKYSTTAGESYPPYCEELVTHFGETTKVCQSNVAFGAALALSPITVEDCEGELKSKKVMLVKPDGTCYKGFDYYYKLRAANYFELFDSNCTFLAGGASNVCISAEYLLKGTTVELPIVANYTARSVLKTDAKQISYVEFSMRQVTTNCPAPSASVFEYRSYDATTKVLTFASGVNCLEQQVLVTVVGDFLNFTVGSYMYYASNLYKESATVLMSSLAGVLNSVTESDISTCTALVCASNTKTAKVGALEMLVLTPPVSSSSTSLEIRPSFTATSAVVTVPDVTAFSSFVGKTIPGTTCTVDRFFIALREVTLPQRTSSFINSVMLEVAVRAVPNSDCTDQNAVAAPLSVYDLGTNSLKINFKLSKSVLGDFVKGKSSPSCVYYDSVSQIFSSSGVTTRLSESEETLTCETTHLTPFIPTSTSSSVAKDVSTAFVCTYTDDACKLGEQCFNLFPFESYTAMLYNVYYYSVSSNEVLLMLKSVAQGTVASVAFSNLGECKLKYLIGGNIEYTPSTSTGTKVEVNAAQTLQGVGFSFFLIFFVTVKVIAN